ncbi:hypothetical protein Tco_1377102 [Tanacetum coccineum]
MNSDIEDDIMDPVMQCTTLPIHSSFSQQKLVSFVTEIHTTSIDFLTPRGSPKLSLPYHKYNIYTVKQSSWNQSLTPAESDSLPHAHDQTTKTYYKHQDSRIRKAQVLKIKTSVNSDKQDLPLRYQVYQGRLLASFQDDAKELVDQAWEKHSHNHFRAPTALDMGNSLERKSFSQTKSVPKTNVSESLSKPVTTQILPQTVRQAVRNTNVIKPGMYQIDTRTTQTRAPQLPKTDRNTNPRVSTSTGVIHKTNVSIPQLRSTQMKDKVVPNNSQVKDKKTEVEDHPRISSISNITKSVTASNDSLKSRTSNVNAVCATCGKCVFNSNHDACVSKYLNDMNARTKKPKAVPISTRKPKSQANKSVATPRKKTVASESTT